MQLSGTTRCPPWGFTLLELVAVMALLGILAVSATGGSAPADMAGAAETGVLRAALRFTQAKAMGEDAAGGITWSLVIAGNQYTLQRDGAAPPAGIGLPPGNVVSRALPAGVSVTQGAGAIGFDFRGRPSLNGVLLAANHAIVLNGQPAVVVTRETGFVP